METNAYWHGPLTTLCEFVKDGSDDSKVQLSVGELWWHRVCVLLKCWPSFERYIAWMSFSLTFFFFLNFDLEKLQRHSQENTFVLCVYYLIIIIKKHVSYLTYRWCPAVIVKSISVAALMYLFVVHFFPPLFISSSGIIILLCVQSLLLLRLVQFLGYMAFRQGTM